MGAYSGCGVWTGRLRADGARARPPFVAVTWARYFWPTARILFSRPYETQGAWAGGGVRGGTVSLDVAGWFWECDYSATVMRCGSVMYSSWDGDRDLRRYYTAGTTNRLAHGAGDGCTLRGCRVVVCNRIHCCSVSQACLSSWKRRGGGSATRWREAAGGWCQTATETCTAVSSLLAPSFGDKFENSIYEKVFIYRS